MAAPALPVHIQDPRRPLRTLCGALVVPGGVYVRWTNAEHATCDRCRRKATTV